MELRALPIVRLRKQKFRTLVIAGSRDELGTIYMSQHPTSYLDLPRSANDIYRKSHARSTSHDNYGDYPCVVD